MMSVFLKAKLSETENAKEVLLFLGGKFVEADELTYHYVQLNPDTVMFLRTDSKGRTYLFTCKTTNDNYSVVTKTPISDADTAKQELLEKHGKPVSFVKHKLLYLLKDAEVAFSTIEGLGTFLELESDQHTYQELKQYIKKFGLSNKDIILTTYNQLLLKKRKHTLSVKR